MNLDMMNFATAVDFRRYCVVFNLAQRVKVYCVGKGRGGKMIMSCRKGRKGWYLSVALSIACVAINI